MLCFPPRRTRRGSGVEILVQGWTAAGGVGRVVGQDGVDPVVVSLGSSHAVQGPVAGHDEQGAFLGSEHRAAPECLHHGRLAQQPVEAPLDGGLSREVKQEPVVGLASRFVRVVGIMGLPTHPDAPDRRHPRRVRGRRTVRSPAARNRRQRAPLSRIPRSNGERSPSASRNFAWTTSSFVEPVTAPADTPANRVGPAALPVEFHPVPVRVTQVECLADAVVGGPVQRDAWRR